jgi:acyl carrier protein
LALAELIVTTLNLESAPGEIDPNVPLYGQGLGLDSIDILEIALAVSKAYGIRLRSDDENNQKIFSSLRSLNQHIQQLRAK